MEQNIAYGVAHIDDEQGEYEQNIAYGVAHIDDEQSEYEVIDQVERKKTDHLTQSARKFHGLRKLEYSSVVSTLALILALLAIILAVVLFINQSNIHCDGCTGDMEDDGGQSAVNSTMAEPHNILPMTIEPATTKPLATVTAPPACGDGPGWRRVAFLNMTDPNQDCPQGLNITSYLIRSCGRSHESSRNCSSVTVPVNGQQYSQVCGRVIAYRWGLNTGFYGYTRRQVNLTGQYLDGISLTHGVETTHIWSFVSGIYQGNWTSETGRANSACPCDPGNTYTAPPFVGNDYFCESAPVNESDYNMPIASRFFPNNTLWDGDGCVSGNSCCQFNNPPWFKKTLPAPTTDDIELRLCFHVVYEFGDIGIQLLEVLVK